MAPIKAIRLKLALALMAILYNSYGLAQQNDRPKLIVGIIIDQMRAEYLYRFRDNYTENGFKRMMREGFNIRNMHYNYMPTATGPGHASVFTGTTPANHGIVANDWYSRSKERTVYCAEDDSVFLTDGAETEMEKVDAYSRSPKNLLASTITDELKLFTNRRSKIVGLSLKDRGAIFPSGHLADYAFWYHLQTGKFITSSYYSKKLPDWLMTFNNRNLADSLLNLNWNTLKPISTYRNSGLDNAPNEKIFNGKKQPTFPYELKKLRRENGDFAMLPNIPFGNTLLTQLSKATVLGEGLGQGNETDFLTISYSSTDYVGHNFGIRSKELEDTYIRLDLEIAELLSFLDHKVGIGRYVVFLTADHAASDHPQFLETVKLPGRYFEVDKIKQQLNSKLSNLYGPDTYIAYMDKTQIYLNPVKTPKEEILRTVASSLTWSEGIEELYVPRLHSNRNFSIDNFFRKSLHSNNSGDILLHFKTGWMPKRNEGTTHGALYNNDKHVPALWFGWHIQKGETVKRKTIDQIAPTLSMLLSIPLPSNSSNEPIHELFE